MFKCNSLLMIPLNDVKVYPFSSYNDGYYFSMICNNLMPLKLELTNGMSKLLLLLNSSSDFNIFVLIEQMRFSKKKTPRSFIGPYSFLLTILFILNRFPKKGAK